MHCAIFCYREWKDPGISASNYRTNPQILFSLRTKPGTKSTTQRYHYSVERVGRPDLCKISFFLLLIRIA